MGFVIVFFGAGIGGAARHGLNLLAMRLGYTAFPLATLSVNVLGSFLIGILAGWIGHRAVPEGWSLFLTTGVLGGFTTFSAFSLDAALMWQRGDYGPLALYIAGSVLLSIGAVFAGMMTVRWLS